MKRIVLRSLWILSLLLLVASVTFWIRSHFREDFLGYEDGKMKSGLAFWSRHGSFTIWYDKVDRTLLDGAMRQRDPGWEYRSTPIKLTGRWPDKNPHTLGFVFAKGLPGQPYYWALAIPWWFVALVLAIPAAVGAIRIIRRRRLPEGSCRKCGYDLRASENRCPECGTPFGLTPT